MFSYFEKICVRYKTIVSKNQMKPIDHESINNDIVCFVNAVYEKLRERIGAQIKGPPPVCTGARERFVYAEAYKCVRCAQCRNNQVLRPARNFKIRPYEFLI